MIVADAAAYEEAKVALAACGLRECQQMARQMAAVVIDAKRAKDEARFTYARRLQLRALRRCGELLHANFRPGVPTWPRAAGRPRSQTHTGADVGMSRYQIRDAVRVAKMPLEAFEQLVEGPNPPAPTRVWLLMRTEQAAAPTSTKLAYPERMELIRALVAEGHTSHQIAAHLGLNVHTVRAIARKAKVTVHADRVMGRTHRHNSTRILDHMVSEAENLASDVDLLNFRELPQARFADWIHRLRAAKRSLESLIRRLETEEQYGQVTDTTTAHR